MGPERLFTTFQTAARGLALQREKIAAASANIANAQTTAPQGTDRQYRPRHVRAEAVENRSFHDVLRSSQATLRRTQPGHIGRSSGEGGTQGNTRGLGPEIRLEHSDRYRLEYQPGHPDADENGMVHYPDVDLIEEMTRLVSANRLFEANLSAIEAEKEIIRRSLEI